MIPRLKDLMSKHRVILYTSYGTIVGITCDNMLAAQELADRNFRHYNSIAGYRIEKV